MASRVERLAKLSVQRGVIEGRLPWTAVAAVVWGGRALRWALEKDEEVVFVETLEPGETLVIAHEEPTKGRPGRKWRRAQRKEAKRAAKLERKSARRRAKKLRKLERSRLGRKARRAEKRAAKWAARAEGEGVSRRTRRKARKAQLAATKRAHRLQKKAARKGL